MDRYVCLNWRNAATGKVNKFIVEELDTLSPLVFELVNRRPAIPVSKVCCFNTGQPTQTTDRTWRNEFVLKLQVHGNKEAYVQPKYRLVSHHSELHFTYGKSTVFCGSTKDTLSGKKCACNWTKDYVSEIGRTCSRLKSHGIYEPKTLNYQTVIQPF